MKVTTTNTTMEFTFSEEERTGIMQAFIAVMVVKETMYRIYANSVYGENTDSSFSSNEVDNVANFLRNLLKEEVWETMTANESRD